MFVAAIVYFYRERRKAKEAEEKLAARGVTAARMDEANKQLATLSDEEREALQLLIVAFSLSGRQAKARLPEPAKLGLIDQRTSFLEFDGGDGRWRARQEWRGVLEQLLCPTPAPPNDWLLIREALMQYLAWLVALVWETVTRARRIRDQKEADRGRRATPPC
jgi:hypothetical protein